MTTRKLMDTCRVKSTRQIGVLTDEEFDFIKRLQAMKQKGNIALIEGEGWVKV